MEEIFCERGNHYLVRAKFVLPISHPLIIDGALEIRDSKILKIGPFRELKREVTQAKLIDLEDLIIMPVLTNAHLHLELSALRFRIPPSGNFLLWVRQVIKKRAQLSPLEMKEGAQFAIKELLKEGIGIVGDVGNTGLSLEPLLNSPICGYLFHEIINFRGEKTNLSPFHETSPYLKITYSAHSPYTVFPLLLRAIKAYNRKRKRLFTIHLAESQEEVIFLKEGRGPIAELLKERGQWNEAFSPKGLSPVKYLDSLEVLDENTLLIHCIHLEEEDYKILAERKAKVCLCPRSNLYTGAGFPVLPLFLRYGIKVCLGTDSLASNDRLSIFEEMKTLYHYYSEVDPLEILKMGTINGAEILGFENWGTLKPSSYANFIAVKLNFPPSEKKEDFLREFLLSEKEVKYRFYGGFS